MTRGTGCAQTQPATRPATSRRQRPGGLCKGGLRAPHVWRAPRVGGGGAVASMLPPSLPPPFSPSPAPSPRSSPTWRCTCCSRRRSGCSCGRGSQRTRRPRSAACLSLCTRVRRQRGARPRCLSRPLCRSVALPRPAPHASASVSPQRRVGVNACRLRTIRRPAQPPPSPCRRHSPRRPLGTTRRRRTRAGNHVSLQRVCYHAQDFKAVVTSADSGWQWVDEGSGGGGGGEAPKWGYVSRTPGAVLKVRPLPPWRVLPLLSAPQRRPRAVLWPAPARVGRAS